MTRPTYADTPLSDVVTSDGPIAGPNDRVLDVARALTAAGVGEAPVVDGSGALVGVISEHDILGKRGEDVAAIMSRGVISISVDATVGDAVELMGLHGVRLLPVVDGNGLVGVVTRSTLLRLFVESR